LRYLFVPVLSIIAEEMQPSPVNVLGVGWSGELRTWSQKGGGGWGGGARSLTDLVGPSELVATPNRIAIRNTN
jgi:hypothetical protein